MDPGVTVLTSIVLHDRHHTQELNWYSGLTAISHHAMPSDGQGRQFLAALTPLLRFATHQLRRFFDGLNIAYMLIFTLNGLAHDHIHKKTVAVFC
jgi:hypothetical protein